MKSIIVILFAFILTFSNSLHAACNSASVLGDNLPASEGECIQRLGESCVWAPDTNAASGFSCQVCDTTVPSPDGKTISECFSAHSGDVISAVVCAAKNSEKLSLDNFCYNSMHGLWQEGSFIGEDLAPANGSDIDSNDVQISGIFSEVKLSTLAASDSLLISEIAVLSAGIPGGSHSVDAMIYNPAGITSINGNAVNTIQRVSPVVLISDFNKLGLGFSTINLDQQTSQEVISSLTPSLAYNYSYISNTTAADLEFFVNNGVPQNDKLLMSDDNLFTRMGIKNKTLGLDTYFDSSVPKFLGLPKEVILEEKRVYTNSLGLASSASTVDIQNRVLEIKTKLSDLKSASVSAAVDLKKQEIKNLSSGIILNIKESNGLYDQKSFSVISPPKFVDGLDTNIRGSSSKSLDDYLESLLNGNIQNSLELISRKDLNEYYQDLAGDSGVSLDSLFGASCANDDDCGGQEKCRKNICTCKNIECSGKSASIYKIDLNLESDDLVVSQTTTSNNNLNNFSGVKTQSRITVLPGSYFKTMNQSLGGITSKVKRNKQVASNSRILNYLLPVDVYANAVTCNNQDTSKSCRTEGNTFYDSDGCPMSRNGDGFATALGACLISYNSKNPETIRGVMFLGEAAECLAQEEGLLLNPGSKQVLVDFSNQDHLNCFGGIKDADMPNSFYLDLTVNSLSSGSYDYEIIYDPSDDYASAPNTSSTDATKFYIGTDSTSSQVISVLALEESEVADYVAMAQFDQGNGVLSFELIDKGVTGQIGRRSRAVVKGTVQSSLSTSSIVFDSSLPIYYSGWQIEYAGQNSDHWYTFTSFENDSTAGKENLVREHFLNRWDDVSSSYSTNINLKNSGICFDRNLNSSATNSNFCDPGKIGVKAWPFLLNNLVGENLVLDFNEIKNTKPKANFTSAYLSNNPVNSINPITGTFCAGLGNEISLNGNNSHTFSSFEWGFNQDLIPLNGSANNNATRLSGTTGGIGFEMHITLNRDRSEGIMHLLFPSEPFYITEHFYAGNCSSVNYSPSSVPKIITSNITDDLSVISEISKYNSYKGHDEADSFNNCGSLKHYFCPVTDSTMVWGSNQNLGLTTSSVFIKAPFDGKIVKVKSELYLEDFSDDVTESEDLQLAIRSDVDPAYTVQFVHLSLSSNITVGDSVTAGQVLGTAFINDGVKLPFIEANGNNKANACFDVFLHVNDNSGSGTTGFEQFRLLSIFHAMDTSVLNSFEQWNSNFTVERLVVNPSQKSSLNSLLTNFYNSDKKLDNYFCSLLSSEVDMLSIIGSDIFVDTNNDGISNFSTSVYDPTEKLSWRPEEKLLGNCQMIFPAPDFGIPSTYTHEEYDQQGNVTSTINYPHSEKFPQALYFGGLGCCTGNESNGICVY